MNAMNSQTGLMAFGKYVYWRVLMSQFTFDSVIEIQYNIQHNKLQTTEHQINNTRMCTPKNIYNPIFLARDAFAPAPLLP